MNEVFNRIKERVLVFYNGLTRNKKIMMYAIIGLAVLTIAIGILSLSRTEYVVIAQGLTDAEAQVITSKMDELNIPWEVSVGTSVVSVPAGEASRARMEIAADIQSANFSWADVFSSESITMTSQTREQMYIQATAAAVERSIQTLTVVDRATVILQIPKESNFFIRDEIKSKASVVLALRQGTQLSEDQVTAIVNLVVSAVKDLTPENVAILDTNGYQLNNPSRELGGFNANSQYDLQYKVQSQIQRDLTNFLERIYGIGNVEVQPRIILDFDRQSETQRLFSPPIEGEITGMVRSATTITENVVNAPGAIGAPGTDTNAGEPTQFVEGQEGGSAYEKASETLNYELNEIYRELVRAQGDIREMSIGVLINSQSLVNEEMTPEHRNELIDLLAMSAGTNRENIRVMVETFTDPLEMYDVFYAEDGPALLFGIPVFALIAIVLVTLLSVVVVMIMMKRKKDKELAEFEEAKALEEQMRLDEEAKLDSIGADKEDKGSPKYHIEQFVDSNPEAAATLLRAWLNDI